MRRRKFLISSGRIVLSLPFAAPTVSTADARGKDATGPLSSEPSPPVSLRSQTSGVDELASGTYGAEAAGAEATPHSAPRPLTLFLAGDVMTGRGIDQILPHSVPPRLHEPYVRSAVEYVRLAEREHGAIERPASYDYVWGDVLSELQRVRPDARVVNLETAITTSEDWEHAKGIHYRMHPSNVRVLIALGIDVCTLGNNHVMDWGDAGLLETLRVLKDAGVRTAGAGENWKAATEPATVDTAAGKLLVFSCGSPTAGVPPHWEAGDGVPGVALLPDFGPRSAERVIDHVKAKRRGGDRVVVSIHWGDNWGYRVPSDQRAFAHRLVEAGAADLVHGHSSHHPKGIEVHQGRAILYGCGDFLNDYEGVGGRERYRGGLTLMYIPAMDVSGALISLEMVPMRIRRFRLERASAEETSWLADTMDRESRKLGARVELTTEGRLRWKRK